VSEKGNDAQGATMATAAGGVSTLATASPHASAEGAVIAAAPGVELRPAADSQPSSRSDPPGTQARTGLDIPAAAQFATSPKLEVGLGSSALSEPPSTGLDIPAAAQFGAGPKLDTRQPPRGLTGHDAGPGASDGPPPPRQRSEPLPDSLSNYADTGPIVVADGGGDAKPPESASEEVT